MRRSINRRHFMGATAAASLSTLAIGATPPAAAGSKRPKAIASGNGLRAVERAIELVKRGHDPLDAAIEGVFAHEPPVRRLARLFLDPNMYLLALLRGRAESMTWTPGLVLDYAARLQAVTQPKARAA